MKKILIVSCTIPTEQERVWALMRQCKEKNCFEYDGEIWLGYYVEACKDFCKSTTYPADFRVWLINNGYKQLK
jgi:hypothetical protein